jgi:3-deoxy-7-phosphoheptulonate synthase
MLIILKAESTREDAERVVGVVEGLGLPARTVPVDGRTMVVVSGYSERPHPDLFETLPGVASVAPVSRPLKRSHRTVQAEDTSFRVGARTVGGGRFTIVAGPCAVEDPEQLVQTARSIRDAGADLLRGGAYKPRTSPYDFQGLGEAGLKMLADVRDETGMPVVTEAVDPQSLELVERYADMIQVGARNMQNFELLKRAGASSLPVLLKRGMSASVEDLLMAAEYILDGGNPNVVLCERGIRTFSDHSRFTLDLSVVPVLKRSTHLPVFVDPSHVSGDRASVPALARAALAAGADGVMIEVHNDPVRALSDGPQSLTLEEFSTTAAALRELAPFIARQREVV